jgi:hypothetical protein
MIEEVYPCGRFASVTPFTDGRPRFEPYNIAGIAFVGVLAFYTSSYFAE